MNTIKIILVTSLLFLLAGRHWAVHIQAEDWQNIIQPIGTLVRVWEISDPPPFPLQPPSRIPLFTAPTTSIEEVNYICAQWDFNVIPQTVPFDLNTAVTEIVLTQPQHFVRLYSPAGSSPNGPWIMSSEYVRGLTPEQLKDRFALPTLPTHIVNVDLPASPDPKNGKDFALWTGIAGPIAGFGNGGAVQNRIIADFNGTHYFPNYEFVIGMRNHPQPIGHFALSYQPMAGNGNVGRIATYLDKFIPQAHTDLENVYTDLDYLNWVMYGPDPIRQALDQISPEYYAAIPFVITRNALLFRNAIFEAYPCLNACCNSIPNAADKCLDQYACEISERQVCGFSVQPVAEFMRERKLGPHAAFRADTGGAVAAFDCLLADDLVAGGCAAGMNNYIHLDHHRGNAHVNTAKLGLYSAYSPHLFLPNAYLCGLITGGYNWIKAHRSIKFPGIDRYAHSLQHGWNIDAHIRGGFSIPTNCGAISPIASLSYFYVHQNAFKEHGADSLDLKVKDFNLQTVRTNLGVDICRFFTMHCAFITAQIELAWAHDYILGNRSIRAGLNGLDGSFGVKSFYRNRDSLITGGLLMAQLAHGLTISGCYDAELASHFTSQSVKLSIDWNY